MNVVYVVHGKEYARMCARSIDSVRSVYPGTVPFVYADREYGLPNELVIPFDEPFMVTNVYAQTLFTMSPEFDQPTLFLDADVIANEPMHIPMLPDLAATWRPGNPMQPYNYGVLIANPSVSTRFAFHWLLDHVANQVEEHQKWYGNQIALRELIGEPPSFDDPTARYHTEVEQRLFTLSVDLLPCTEWNWTPDKPDEPIEGRAFIHVKGDRKDMFDHYYTRAAA